VCNVTPPQLYGRLLSDALTPVSAFHQIDTGGSACLFESVIGGEKVGRYSFLAVDPFLQITARGTTVTVESEGRREELECSDPLDKLRALLAPFKAVHLPELPPFEGGAIGYAGYDVVRYVENLLNAPRDDRGLPDLSFAFYDRMVVFDNVSKPMFVVAMARLDKHGGNAKQPMTTRSKRTSGRQAFASLGLAANRHRHQG
jgi:anthranilate synthase component 1